MENVLVLNLLSVLVTCDMYLNNIWWRFLEVLECVWLVFGYCDCTLFCTADIMLFASICLLSVGLVLT